MKNRIIAAAIIILLAGVIIYSRNRRRVSPPTHHPAPEFSLTDINGQKLNLAAYRGKVVLLDFWATWCAPCQVEIPHFIEMQKKYGPDGLQIIGISLDDNIAPVRSFYAKHNMNYPVALGDDKLAERYGGILGLPVGFVIDRDGRIYSKHTGETDPAVFEREVSDVLKSSRQ